MISKEEIKESKQCLDEIIVNTYAEGKSKKLYNLQIYIQQLENKVREVEAQRNELATELSENEDDKQKLIDKLEYRKFEIECLSSQINGNYFMKQDELDLINESLSIAKGGK